MPLARCAIYAALIACGPVLTCSAGQVLHSICAMVRPDQLAVLHRSTLYPSPQENGCRWSDTKAGTAYFQIGIIESQKNLRSYFEKQIPSDYTLKKINDIGDRGLYTESRGCMSVIAIREGRWVLISTVDLLYIKKGDARQSVLWEIYRGILKSLD